MPDLRFRRAQPDDAEEVLEIKREAIEELEHWQYSPEQVEAWAPKDSYEATFEEAIASDQFEVHVAEAEAADVDLVGYGVLTVAEERIDSLYVRPAHHGQGVATALIKQLELSAEFEGVDSLDVLAARNAVPFYEQVGYVALRDEVTTIDDVDLELVRMRKHLPGSDPEEWFENGTDESLADPDLESGEDASPSTGE